MFFEGNGMKTDIVDVCGGLCGIYATGIFDWCLS